MRICSFVDVVEFIRALILSFPEAFLRESLCSWRKALRKLALHKDVLMSVFALPVGFDFALFSAN